MKRFLTTISAYLALAGIFLCGAWFTWRGIDAITYFLIERQQDTPEILKSVVARQSGFIVMSWAVIVGLFLLVFMVFAESFLRRGMNKGQLNRHVALSFAPWLILIALADSAGLAARGWNGTWIYWIVLLFELAAGIGLFIFGRPAMQSRRKTTPVDPPSV